MKYYFEPSFAISWIPWTSAADFLRLMNACRHTNTRFKQIFKHEQEHLFNKFAIELKSTTEFTKTVSVISLKSQI